MKKRKHRGAAVIVLGILLMVIGGGMLLNIRGGLMQYAVGAPIKKTEGDTLAEFYEEAQKQLMSIGDSLAACGIAARAQGVMVESADGRSMQCTLYAAGEGYFDVVHETLRSGRLISGADIKKHDAVIVLDEGTALALFSGDDAEGQKVTLNGGMYEVAGVIRGGRRIGETDEHIAYIPITAADNVLAMQTVELAALGKNSVSSAILMRDTLASWQSGGSFYSFDKLKLGAVMPLRWTALLAGALLLLNVLLRLNALVLGRICLYAEQLKTQYARDMLPGMCVHAALGLLGYAALGAALFCLSKFAIAPLYVFTDWVPEVMVELSSLVSRFWALNDAGASAIRYSTAALCYLELARGLVRWGLLVALVGLVLHGIPWLNAVVNMPHVNRER